MLSNVMIAPSLGKINGAKRVANHRRGSTDYLSPPERSGTPLLRGRPQEGRRFLPSSIYRGYFRDRRYA